MTRLDQQQSSEVNSAPILISDEIAEILSVESTKVQLEAQAIMESLPRPTVVKGNGIGYIIPKTTKSPRYTSEILDELLDDGEFDMSLLDNDTTH